MDPHYGYSYENYYNCLDKNSRYELTKKHCTTMRIMTHSYMDPSHKQDVGWTKPGIKHTHWMSPIMWNLERVKLMWVARNQN